jgi:hypothetical protein
MIFFAALAGNNGRSYEFLDSTAAESLESAKSEFVAIIAKCVFSLTPPIARD